ncbi:hypothetical protein PF008_g18674 [Phytophthora fragariae]|uniref:S-adenosyl-L-methionine-dependent methyltransferase n=1 Tax=Phytophthora fragariae TaxID=53985 RepID=A0A6G0R4L8_9STRA|nr:hypothetical protein PF008_g18674 [Phytophthora fragariae]
MQNEDFAQFTSFVDALLRAVEGDHEDPLIHDQFAEPLTREIAPQLKPRLKKWELQQPHPEDYVALRCRYLDEALAQRHPSIRQVVLLGAGLDTRVFRLETLRGCHVLEIDQSAELFEHKRAESLLSSGFNPDVPTFWALEGIMMYLTRASNLALLKTIDILSAPGSEVWGDVSGRAFLQEGEIALFKDVSELSMAELGEPLFKHGEEDVREGVFSELPWEMDVQAALAEPGTHFGREWTPTLTRSEQKPVTYHHVLAKKPLADVP